MPATRVIAHQGACMVRRPNTVAAFLEAGRMGADGVELDVHLTADGAMVVHHDPTIEALGVISSLRVTDLPDFVPTLDQAIDACEGMDLINIEVKANPGDPDADTCPALVTKVAALVGERRLHGRVLVSAFSMDTIDAMRSADAGIRTAWLTGAAWDQIRAVGQAAERGHVALHPYFTSVTAELIAAAHDAGLEVNTWTCDDPERMATFASWGIDGICTNLPDVAVEVLRG